MITLYGKGPTRSMRALWALKESQLEYDYREVNLMEREHLSEKFAEINPYKKVPVLIDGDYTVTESTAIVTYIGRISGTSLVPEPHDFKSWAKLDQWLSFLNCEIDANLFNIEKHVWRYPENERSELAIEKARLELQPSIAIIEDQLKKSEFLMGDTFTVADIINTHCLNWARSRGVFKDNACLDDYTKRMYKRDAYPRELYKKA